jgi:hypothetical protein
LRMEEMKPDKGKGKGHPRRGNEGLKGQQT